MSRYELKIVIAQEDVSAVYQWLQLSPALFTRQFRSRQVSNLYFDSWDVDDLQDALDGVSHRHKLRLRWYSQPADALLQLKEKNNLRGSKTEASLRLPQKIVNATAHEISQLLKRRLKDERLRLALTARPQPTLWNSYQREYFFSRDYQLRMTIDRHIFSGAFVTSIYRTTQSATPTSKIVVEFKLGAEFEVQAQKIIASFPFATTKSSKYVQGLVGWDQV